MVDKRKFGSELMNAFLSGALPTQQVGRSNTIFVLCFFFFIVVDTPK